MAVELHADFAAPYLHHPFPKLEISTLHRTCSLNGSAIPFGYLIPSVFAVIHAPCTPQGTGGLCIRECLRGRVVMQQYKPDVQQSFNTRQPCRDAATAHRPARQPSALQLFVRARPKTARSLSAFAKTQTEAMSLARRPPRKRKRKRLGPQIGRAHV